jgi:hypothetical protein
MSQLAARSITQGEAEKLLAPHQARIDGVRENDEVDGVIDLESIMDGGLELHTGDLAVDSLIRTSESPSLFVTGNVNVQSVLKQEFNAGYLIVFGNLTAHHAVTTSGILVLGNLKVSGTLYGNSTNFTTTVLGHVQVGTLVSAKEHLFSFYGPREIMTTIDVEGDTPNLDDADMIGEDLEGALDEELTDIRDEEQVFSVLSSRGALLTSDDND